MADIERIYVPSLADADTYEQGIQRVFFNGYTRLHSGYCANHFFLEYPLDLKPIDEIIADCIRAKMLQLEGSQKLFIFIGEYDSIISTHIPKIAALKYLRDNHKDNSLIGFPGERQKYVKFASSASNDASSLTDLELIEKVYDGLQQPHAMSRVGNSVDVVVPLEYLIFYHCIQSSLHVAFTKAIEDNNKNIDLSSDLARAAADKVWPNAAHPIKANKNDPMSLAIQNAIMVARALDFVGERQIILQPCGISSVLGHKDEFSYQHSLTAIAKQEGHLTLSILPETDRDNTFVAGDFVEPPDDAYKDNEDTVMIDNMEFDPSNLGRVDYDRY